MSRIPITPDEMTDAINALHAVLPKFGLTPDSTPVVVRAYRDALLPMDGEAVRGGQKLGLREWDKFPSPKAWREKCAEWVKRNRTTLEWKPEETNEGHTVACRVCKSYARPAWLRNFEGLEISRLIAPCNPERHQPTDSLVPIPPNFLAWDDRPIEPWVPA